MSRRPSESGFTLIEMLLSVSILVLIVGVSLPIYESFTRRNDLDIAVQSLANTYRRAATYARSGNKDSQWGVEVVSGAMTLFIGTSYAGRDTNYDETTTFPTNIAISGTTQVVFSQLTGMPTSTGSTTFTGGFNTRTVTINAKGMVDY